MAKNRIRPYGYKMADEKIVIEPQEAESIHRIYRQYAAGLSYKTIAEKLTADGIRYMPEKPTWNKNMVARILQNESYLGTDKYPAIIEAAEYHAAQQSKKPYTHTESPDIKTFKPLLVCGICGEPIKRRLKTDGGERWYCPADVTHIATAVTDETLLHSISNLAQHLAEKPRTAKQCATASRQISLKTIQMPNQTGSDLYEKNLDYTASQEKIISLIKQRSALYRDKGEEGMDIVWPLIALQGYPSTFELLRAITEQIKVEHTQVTALILKNGKKIWKRNQS